MALMRDPTDADPENITEQDTVIALEEDGDVAQENSDYATVAGFVESQFQRAKDSRRNDEDRWLMAYRNYRGIYGPEVQFTNTEKSKAFVKITKTKVLASYATDFRRLICIAEVPNRGTTLKLSKKRGRGGSLRSKCPDYRKGFRKAWC